MTLPIYPPALPPPLSPHDVKAVVRHRDGYRCTECGMPATEHLARHGRTLDVHRIVPGSAYTVDGCQTLCVECHRPKPKSTRLPQGGKRPLEVPAHLVEQLRFTAKTQRRTLTAVVHLALIDYFTSLGRWPRPAPPPS